MKYIHQLVPDILQQVKLKGGWFNEELAHELSSDIARRMQVQFGVKERRGLRLSAMGPKCPKALWHSIHTPELAEALPAWTEIKFCFGDMMEALALTLAHAAGHEVTGEQDELVLDGVVGHRDCVIDGCVVDVKSCSSIAFQKFKTGSIVNDDSFGYLDQLDGYVVASLEDPLVRVKDKGYILAIDKTLGHMCLYEHAIRTGSIRSRISEYKMVVSSTESPACRCGTTPDGVSGNIKLDTRASYSAFKFNCFPSLRTFLYSNGPRYLTKVVRVPDVQEINKYGKPVYNR